VVLQRSHCHGPCYCHLLQPEVCCLGHGLPSSWTCKGLTMATVLPNFELPPIYLDGINGSRFSFSTELLLVVDSGVLEAIETCIESC
jgi:hypothetical protein